MQLETWLNQRSQMCQRSWVFVNLFQSFQKKISHLILFVKCHRMNSGLYEQQTQVLMKLRVYCSRYRRYTPQKLSSQSGSLRFNIPNYMLENFNEEGFTVKEISGIVYMSERALCRRMNQYNLSKISFTNDSDAYLDKKVHKICVQSPYC